MLIFSALLNIFSTGPDNVFLEQGQKALFNAGFLGWLQAIRFGLIITALSCMAFKGLERTVATINLKTYETWTNNGISTIFIISHLILGSIISFIFFSGMFNIELKNKNLRCVSR